VSRRSASAPPPKCGATPRITANALAQASTVTTMATSTGADSLLDCWTRSGAVVMPPR